MKIKCIQCKQEVEIPVTEEQVLNWIEKGTFIQNEFPELSTSQREMLLSGICEDCWNKLFPEEE